MQQVDVSNWNPVTGKERQAMKSHQMVGTTNSYCKLQVVIYNKTDYIGLQFEAPYAPQQANGLPVRGNLSIKHSHNGFPPKSTCIRLPKPSKSHTPLVGRLPDRHPSVKARAALKRFHWFFTKISACSLSPISLSLPLFTDDNQSLISKIKRQQLSQLNAW